MVIKRFRELCEESAFSNRPESSMLKFSASMNSDIRNGSFWIEIRDA